MHKLTKDLQGVLKSLKVLAKKTEKLAMAVGKHEKAKAAGKKKLKTGVKKVKKAKATKKATIMKKKTVKKTIALTATDQVVKIIKKYKKGVDVSTLKKKTGFEDKKIRNILNRSSKQGKIKGAGRGIYIAA